MRLPAHEDRAEEGDEIGDPDDRQPEIDIPFRLGVFAALGDAEQVAGCRQYDEELIAPEYEPAEIAAEETCTAGALDDIKRGGDQRVAAEGEDDGRGVERPHAAEIEPWLDVEVREGELQRHDDADQEADDAPEYRGDHAVLNDLVEIFRLRGCPACDSRAEVDPSQEHDRSAEQHEEQHPHMCAKKAVLSEAGPNQRQEGADPEHDHLECIFHGWVPQLSQIADDGAPNDAGRRNLP